MLAANVACTFCRLTSCPEPFLHASHQARRDCFIIIC